MSRFLSPTLEAVTPYTPGEQPQDQQYIKLNTNESPYLPSPRVVAAVSEAEVEKLRLYSDPACAQLLRTAAGRCAGHAAFMGGSRVILRHAVGVFFKSFVQSRWDAPPSV